MPDIKEKPKMGKPKTKSPAMLTPKQAARMMVSKYRRQLDQRIPGEENETEYATDCTEGAATGAVEELTGCVHGPTVRYRADKIKECPRQPEQPPTGESAPAGSDASPAPQNPPKERPASIGGEIRANPPTHQQPLTDGRPGQRPATGQR